MFHLHSEGRFEQIEMLDQEPDGQHMVSMMSFAITRKQGHMQMTNWQTYGSYG